MTLRERVQKGCALLDDKRPGWEKEIDLDRLDIFYSRCCVLGQIYGSFCAGLGMLPIPYEDVCDFGFAAGELVPKDLTTEWRKQIIERLGK